MARFVRKIHNKSGTYYALVESRRQRGKVVQKHLKSLGKTPPPKNYERWLMPIDDRRKVPFRVVSKVAGEYTVWGALVWPYKSNLKSETCSKCGQSRLVQEEIHDNDFNCQEWLIGELGKLRLDFDELWLVKALSQPSALRRVQKGEAIDLIPLVVLARLEGSWPFPPSGRR